MKRLLTYINNVEHWLLGSLFFSLPFFFTPILFDKFDLAKYYIFIYSILILAFISVFRFLIEKSIIFPKSKILIAAAVFFLAYFLSTLLSIDIYSSIFGNYPKIHDGLLFIMGCIFLTWVISVRSNEKIIKLIEVLGLGLGLSVCWGAFVAVASFLQTGNPINRQESTFGNVAYFSQAAQAEFFLSLALFFALPDKFKKTVFMILAFLSFYTVLVTGTRSVWISFIISIFLGFLYYAKAFLKFKIKNILILGFVICVAIALVFGTLLQNRFKDLPDITVQTSQGIRLLEWKDGIKTFLNGNIWLGSGPETLIFTYPQYRSQELNNNQREWNFLPQNVRNVYLNYLSSIGLVGTSIYILLVSLVLFTGFNYLSKEKNIFLFWILIAFFSQVIANFFYNYGIFSHVYFWVLIGLIIQLTNPQTACIQVKSFIKIPALIFLLLTTALFIYTSRSFLSDLYFTKSLKNFNQISVVRNQNREGLQNNMQNYLAAKDLLQKIDIVYLEDTLSAALISSRLDSRNRVTKRHIIALFALIGNYHSQTGDKEKAIEAYTNALDYAKELVRGNKYDFLNYSLLSTIGYHATRLGLDLPNAAEIAKSAGERAVSLNPTSPLLVNNLGEVYWLQHDLDRAEKIFRKAILLKKDFFPSYYHLADILIQKGNKEEAKNIYLMILSKTPDATLAKERLQELSL